MTNKELYTSPEVDVYTLQTEGVICESTGEMGINPWNNGTDFPVGF